MLPSAIARASILRAQNFRNGSVTRRSSSAAVNPPALSASHWHASMPAVMEPPDTAEIRSRLARYPSSLSRMSVPIWKSVARNPPPDKASAMPGRSVPFVIDEPSQAHGAKANMPRESECPHLNRLSDIRDCCYLVVARVAGGHYLSHRRRLLTRLSIG